MEQKKRKKKYNRNRHWLKITMAPDGGGNREEGREKKEEGRKKNRIEGMRMGVGMRMRMGMGVGRGMRVGVG